MKNPVLLFCIFLITVPGTLFSQRLDLFTSETGNVNDKGTAERVPYSQTHGFYDFLPADLASDTIINGKPGYFIYFRVPYEVSEIGVRLLSPVPEFAHPHPGDEVTPAFESEPRSRKYFNPRIAVEMESPWTSERGSDTASSWQMLGWNIDSEEAMPQPNGRRSNALLRIFQGPYPAGNYRVVLSTENQVPAPGGYLLEVGTIPPVKRLKIGRTPPGTGDSE